MQHKSIKEMMTKYAIDRQTMHTMLTNTIHNSTHSKELQLQDRFIITNKSYILNKNIIQHKIDTITQTLPQLTQISKSIIVEKDVSKVFKETQFKTKTKTHIKTLLQHKSIKEMMTKYAIDTQTMHTMLTNTIHNSTHSKELQLQDRFIITNKSYILNKNIIQHKIDTITQTLPQLTQISKSIIVEKDVSKVFKETQFKTKTKTHIKTLLQ
ncbi:MAG: hypothetical protein Q9M36_03895, partial [Sulfurovum sp.]|nr:hypothetical protein [Sulfurovum sp.]